MQFNMRLPMVCGLLFAALSCAFAAGGQDLPINWQALPPPYDTPSAVNPPALIERPAGATLSLPAGFVVEEYMRGFYRPRFLLAGEHGEILLSDIGSGIVYVLQDKVATPLIRGLDRPYGLALHQGYLYVAEASAIKRYRYDAQKMQVEKGEEIISLLRYASGHITRSLLIDEQARKLYVSVGSRSNVSDGEPPIRAAISRYNLDGSGHELFASGIRNPIGLRWYPGTRDLWATSHERDGLGDDLVPDYLTRVVPGGFYGWPYAYIGPHEDPRHAGKAPQQVAKTLYPSVLLGSHVGAMDLLFYTGSQFPKYYYAGAFIALHGSWNRSLRSGYKIVFVPFAAGEPLAGPRDFLTGWRLAADKKEVWGRPVGLLQMADGSLLISDDGAGKLWRISYVSNNSE